MSLDGRRVSVRRLIGGDWRDQAGISAIEYALIAALVAMVIISAVVLLGENVSSLYETISGNVKPPT